MSNFIEKFLMGTPDPQTGETTGGIPAVADFLWPFEDMWVSGAVDSTAGKVITAGPRANAWLFMRGLQGLEWAESNLIARPTSTALQASATSKYNVNPLYRDGIQWQDFVDMWNASEYISPARALVQRQVMQQSPIDVAPGAPQEQADLYRAITNPYPTTGGVSPQQYEDAWDNSPLGTVVSGAYDLAFLLLAGGKGVNAAASTVKKAAGLNTQVTELRQLTVLRDSVARHREYRATNGESGKFSVPGQLIEDLAKETDVARIRSSPLLTNWTRPSSFNADELSTLISKTDDPELITELVLADRGDALALGRLFNTAPDAVWSLTHMNDKLAREFAVGGQFIPSPQQARVIQTTFDSAVERDEFFATVRDIFMTGRLDDPLDIAEDVAAKIDGVPIASARGQRLVALTDDLDAAKARLAEAEDIIRRGVGGGDARGRATVTRQAALDDISRLEGEIASAKKAPPARDEFDVAATSEPGKLTAVRGTGADFLPMGAEGVAPIANTVGMAQRWARRIVADARINRPNSYVEVPLGSRGTGPLTTLLFWAGGRQPLNMVNYSRHRPDEIVEEMTAYSRSSRALRKGQWTVTATDPKTGLSRTEAMPSWQWRAKAIERIAAAKTQGDVAVDATVRDLQEELISVIVNRYAVSQDDVVRIKGGLQERLNAAQDQVVQDGYYMDGAERIIIDARTMRELPNMRILMPLDDLDWALRNASTTVYARRGKSTRRVLRAGAATLDVIFKWFRTNVLFRGGYVPKNSFAGPGVSAMLADGSLLPRDGLASTLKRFDANNDRRILQFKFAVADRLPFTPASRDQSKARQIFLSYQEKSRRLDELEEYIADLDSAGTSPATRAQYLGLAQAERKIVYTQVKDLERELDLLDDAWTQVDEIPTYAELADRVTILRSALTDPDFVATATNRIDELRDLAVTRQSGARDLAANLTRINALKQQREAAAAAGKSTRRLDEEISSLQVVARNQASKRTPSSGLTPVEQAEIDQLSALVFARSKVDVGDLDPQLILDDMTARLDKIREQTFTLEPTALKEMQKLRDDLSKLDAERATLSGRIAARQLARERLQKRDLSGETDYEMQVGGIKYTIPAPFGTTGNYGTALRAETSADLTAAQTMTGGRLNGAASGMRWRQSQSGEVIQPYDPRYWDELTHVINRHIVGDDFANQILTGKSDVDIMKWFQTPVGKRYMQQMGWTYDELRGGPRGSVPATPMGTGRATDARITMFEEGIIANQRRILNQYFPDPEFRRNLATSREWTPGEVQSALGGIEGLSPIYGTGLEFIGNRLARVGRATNNALNSIWRLLAARPESRFARWPFFTREYSRQMQREIRIAQERGQIVDGDALQAMKNSAQTRTLKEMENTFYNVRRMTNPVFALRYITAFAAAGWNSTYRYFRLAYRNPGRATVMANTWFNILEAVGTDADGNDSESWKDTEYLTFSFPDEWGIPVQSDLKISADAINLGTQEFGFTPTVQIPVSMALRKKPDLERTIRERYPDVWDALFEFGTGTDPNYEVFGIPLDPLMGSYQKKGVLTARNIPEIAGLPNPFFQEIPDEDWLRVASQDYDYQMYQWAKDGQQGPIPKFEDSLKNAEEFYIEGTIASWASPSAVKPNSEADFLRNEWYKIRSSFPGNFPAAIAQARLMYGPEFFFFMNSTSTNRAGMPPTQDAYDIWRNNEGILTDFREMSPEDPNMLTSLLFLDEQTYNEADFSEVIYNWQQTAFIPGDTEPVRSRQTGQEREDEYKRGRSWAVWNQSVAKRDALMLQYGFKSLSPDNESAWLHTQWEQFKTEFEGNPENALWKADRVFDPGKTQRALDGIQYLLSDRKFMSSIGASPTWQAIRSYRLEMSNAQQFYDAAETPDERATIARQWDEYVRTTFLPQAGNFANYYERYLSGKDLSGGRQMLDSPYDPNRGFPLPMNMGVPSNE